MTVPVGSGPDPRTLRRTRDALLREMAASAEALPTPSGDGSPKERERWIALAAQYVSQRQAAVDRLAEIDAALGGEGPEPTCRADLERILAADRMLLSESARLMARIQDELTDRHADFRAVRNYVLTAADPGPSLTRTG